MLTEWCVDYWEATRPYSMGGSYVNFMMDEGQERVRATYGSNYTRLSQIKAKYDPDNVFNVNQNIRPA
jgi:FAD/FMN-containing dehydrogenase